MICLTSYMRGPPSRPTASGARPRPAQYPGEAEVTFPPFTCLEADGEARLERTKDGEVVIFPLKVTWAARSWTMRPVFGAEALRAVPGPPPTPLPRECGCVHPSRPRWRQAGERPCRHYT